MADILGIFGGESREDAGNMRASVATDVNTYIAKLEKLEGTFGFGYRCLTPSPGGLIITALVQESAVAGWNAAQDVVDAVCVGDRILSCNGKFEPVDIVQELKSCQEAELKLLKSGPRWHIMGITADCLLKIDKAVGRGMKMSTKAHEEEEKFKQRTLKGPDPLHMVMMVAGCCGPALLLMCLFSDMFYGIYVYSLFSETRTNLFGNFVVVAVTCFAIGLYVADWSQWTNKLHKQTTAAITIYGYAFGFILKCRYYPFAPLVVCLFHVVIFLAIMRMTVMRAVRRRSFYLVAGIGLLVVGLCVLALWIMWMCSGTWNGMHLWSEDTKDALAKSSKLIYENSILSVNGVSRSIDYQWDCKPSTLQNTDFDMINNIRVSTGHVYSQDEINSRDKLCGTVKTIWFLMWLSPFVCVLSYIMIALFCLGNTMAKEQDASRIEKLLKSTILMVFVIIMVMWVSASIAGASMRLTGTLMAFCGTAMIALFIWIYLEIGKQALTATIRNSKMMQTLVTLATSDWVRAGLVMAFNVLIPGCLAITMLNQKVRKVRGKTQSQSRFTEGAEKVINSLAHWNWGSIFVKVNWLVIAYWVFSIGVAKAVYVFLSWLNETLLQVDLAVVIIIFFFIGVTMFLLPPVPGIPVYITSGIVLAARCSVLDVGFWGGVGIAIALSFVLKITACAGQYLIGYFLGKSVKVQQLVAVDKVFTKAIEKILKTRGLNLPKVSVLVGGPDWPTSVLCGILRLNLGQILLGTCPVIIVSTPCVLAGAFLAGPNAGKPKEDTDEGDGIWSTMSSSALAVSALVQLASAVIAMYYIQDVVYKHSDELSVPRKEHEPVTALTQKEAEWVQAYQEVLEWQHLTKFQRILILFTTGMFLLSMAMFMFMDEACFRPFQMNSRIGDPYGQGGLEGNAISIVHPFGWFAQALWTIASVMHWIFLKSTKRAARIHFAEKKQRAGTPDSRL